MSHSLRRLKPAARPIPALFIACLFAVFAAVPQANAVTDPFTTPGTPNSWTAPAGVTSITVECWGAGGGGGGDSVSNSNSNGGGGGGGAYGKATFTVTPGSSYAVAVGTGGAGGSGTANGSAGSDSTFNGTTCVADGGTGGRSATNGGTGGTGGQASASTGNLYSGGNGSNSISSGGGGGGGGGGSAGTANNGNSVTNSRTGASAVTGGGPGGTGAANGNGGAPASGPGGGGGGGKYDTAIRDGGAGFNGQILITYQYATVTTISCSAGPFTYTGSPITPSCTASVTGPNGLNQTLTVNYSGNTNAGTATASATFAATADYLTSSASTTFTINPAPTTTTVTCGAGPFTYTGAAQTPCSATVTGAGGLNQAVAVSYSNNTNAGTATATATYAATTNYLTSTDSKNFTINKANPTLSISNSPQVYDGTAKSATVNGSVAGTVSNVLYAGSSTAPTNAGTYAVTADFTPTNANYNTLSGASAGNFVINKATPTVAVTNSPVTYNTAQQAATVVGSVPGTVSNILYGASSTAPTNAGTYAVKADFAPTDSTNFNTLSGAAAGNFVINKASPTLAVNNSPQVYNGSPRAATVAAALGVTPVGGTVSNILYGGSGTAPTNAGSYVVTANFAPGDTTNYNSVTNGAAGSFVINKATPTLSISNTPQVYDGTPKAATVTGSVAGTVSNVQYDAAATAPTNAGTYAVTADFIPTNANYNTLSGASAGSFVINKAAVTLSISNSPVVYSGAAQAATVVGSVAGTVSNVLYGASSAAPTNAGTYAVKADFTPTNTNYNTLSGASAGNFVINKATPTLAVTNSPQVYNGAAQAATVVGSVAGTVSNVRYNGSLTVPTGAGSYPMTANFVPTDGTNYNSLTSTTAGNFVIDKAPTTTTVTCTGAPFTYTGLAQTPCAASVTGAGGLNQSGLTVTYSNNTNAGTASASATYAATANYLTSSDSTTFTIGKATPTLSVTNSPLVFDGTARTATVVGSVGGAVSNIQYAGSSTAPTNAGTYAVTADFAPTDDVNYNSLTGGGAGSLVINKAPSTTTVTCTGAPFTYTGSAQTPCSATTTGVGGLNQPGLTVTYANNINAGTASASATYAATANYLTSTGSTTFTIGKATLTLAVANTPVTFNGTPKTAIIGATGPTGAVTGVASNIKYNSSLTAPSNAGSYGVTANFVPGDTTNYNSLTDALAGSFVIDKATTTTSVSCSGGPFTYTGSAISPTCTAAATGAGGLNQTGLAVSFADNINAGTATASADYAGAANYLPSTGSTTFTIGKATPVLAVGNTPVVYDGTAKTATLAASSTPGSVAGTFANIEYGLSATAPTNAGSYAVTADFTPDDDINYNSLTAASAGSFVINKASSSTTVTCTGGPFAYTGAAQTPCTATATGPGGLNLALTVSYANNTNAGTATADATYAASANYLGSSDSTTFTIGKAPTITAVTCDAGPFVYTGAAQTPCAAGVTGPGGLNLALTVVYAGNTGAGTASASASYGGTANYLGSSDNTTFTIDKADPLLAVTNSPQVYDGTPKSATIVASATAGTVSGALSNIEYGLTPGAPTNAGTYAVTADFTPNDPANYNSLTGAAAGNFTIGKAASTTAVTCNAGPFPYTGAGITPCAAVVTGPGGLNQSLTVVYADNINAGTATADAGYAVSANYFGSSDGTTFAIAKAQTTTTVTCAAGPFTYTGAAQTPCTAAATGPGGLNQALAVVYGSNTGAGTATADASYAGAANYLPSSDNANFLIGKATPVLAVSNSPQVYDGNAKAAAVAATLGVTAVPGNAGNIRYDGATTDPSEAGIYAVTADFLPTDTANFNPVSGGDAGSFVIQPAATTTAVTCSAGPFVYNGGPHEPCAAVATGPGGLNQAVPVVYADNTNAGTAAAGATYPGSGNYAPSNGSATFTIDKADPVLSITNSPATYDGTAKTAAVSGSVVGSVSNVKYNGSATEPVGAGSYAVTADFVPDDGANYSAISGTVVGSFVINKADPTLSITNSPADYDGTPKAANVVGSVPGTASNLTYNTIGASPTNAGTYAVNADFLPQDTDNYNSLTGAPAGNFVIQKAGTPILSVSNTPLIFNGSPQAAVVVGSVAGTPANVLYNGSPTVPVDAGSYVITADYTPDDLVNYDTVTGAAAGTMVIDQAPTAATVTCAAGPFTYNAAAIEPCTASVSGPGGLSLALAVVYAGNIDAGTASASATYAGDANYLPSSNSATFTINMADPTLAVTNSPAAYDGTPKTANVVGSVPGTVSNIRYNGSANPPVDAGTYAITADFVPDDGANYNSLSGANAGNFVVQKAGVPVLTVSNSPVVFTGAAQTVVVVGSVPGTVSNIRYDGSPTAPSDAGSYVVTVDFVPDDTVNYDSITGVSAGSFVIGRAATTTELDCGTGPYTYTGAAITPCTATATGPGGLSEGVTVSYSSNVNVGTAAAGANYAGGANYLPSSAAGSFAIFKAPTTTTITCGSGPFAYSGSPIEPCAATVSGPGGLSHAVPVVYADNLVPGTASVSASFAGGINYLPSAGTATFTIDKAPTTVTVTCSGGPFTYSGVAFTPCAAEVSGPDGLSGVLPVVYENNTGAGTATASASYAGEANYAASTGTATFAIAKAPTATMVTCAAGPFTVTGVPIEPCTASVTGAGGLSQALAVSYVNNTGAGTATASASYSGSTNYLPSSDTEVFVIGATGEAKMFLNLPFLSR